MGRYSSVPVLIFEWLIFTTRSTTDGLGGYDGHMGRLSKVPTLIFEGVILPVLSLVQGHNRDFTGNLA